MLISATDGDKLLRNVNAIALDNPQLRQRLRYFVPQHDTQAVVILTQEESKVTNVVEKYE